MLEGYTLGLCEMVCLTRDWGASWDPRRRELVFARSSAGRQIFKISLGLESLGKFQQDLRALTLEEAAYLKDLLETWPTLASGLDAGLWLAPFERLACFLAASALARGVDFRCSGGRLMVWLLAQGSSQTWLQRYNDSLSFASRYRLLNRTVEEMRTARNAEQEMVQLADISDRETREIYWFTVRMQHALATEWYERNGISSVEAGKAQRQSHLTYLQMLREEPYRKELETFLALQKSESEFRSGTESEVARLLQLGGRGDRREPSGFRGEAYGRGRLDEGVDGIFFSWFMQRYDQSAGRRLMWRGLTPGERRATRASIVFVLIAWVLFAFEVHQRGFVYAPQSGHGLRLSTLELWMIQVGFQLMALVTAAWLAPKCFNFVLPRALFGSLLTWITLILTSLPGLWAVELEGRGSVNLRELAHRFMSKTPYAGLVAVPITLLASVFIMRQIGQWTEDRGLILLRGLLTTGKLYLGSLFWGILFAVPIRSVIEKQTEPCPSCLLPIACVGASLAALFGIIVELVWEDKSIAEPLEDPL